MTMEFKRFKLVAFGKFSGQELEFKPSPNGLHVVHGPNEAGKSTVLRGIRSFLYGIDTRTTDNFLYPYDKLNLEAVLLDEDKKEFHLRRTKGRQGTLTNIETDTDANDLLRRMLGGFSQEIFDTLLGLDREKLIKGGENILQQKGDLGNILFGAAIGQQAYEALETLEKQSQEIFKPQREEAEA